jgi:hypothetical protein
MSDVVKASKGLTVFTPNMDCDQTAIGHLSRLQYFLINCVTRMKI